MRSKDLQAGVEYAIGRSRIGVLLDPAFVAATHRHVIRERREGRRISFRGPKQGQVMMAVRSRYLETAGWFPEATPLNQITTTLADDEARRTEAKELSKIRDEARAKYLADRTSELTAKAMLFSDLIRDMQDVDWQADLLTVDVSKTGSSSGRREPGLVINPAAFGQTYQSDSLMEQFIDELIEVLEAKVR